MRECACWCYNRRHITMHAVVVQKFLKINIVHTINKEKYFSAIVYHQHSHLTFPLNNSTTDVLWTVLLCYRPACPSTLAARHRCPICHPAVMSAAVKALVSACQCRTQAEITPVSSSQQTAAVRRRQGMRGMGREAGL